MAVRQKLRSGGSLIARRKNELWYRRRLKVLTEDLMNTLAPPLRSYAESLGTSSDALNPGDRALIGRDIQILIQHAQETFKMPFNKETTAQAVALMNLRSTDEWWTKQMRGVVEVPPSSLPQPRISDALRRQRAQVGVRAGAVQPLATLSIIRGQELVQAAFENAVATNINLITTITDLPFERMTEVLLDHVESAERWETLVDKLREGISQVNNLAQYRVELIARDQTSKMASAFNEARCMAVGIEMYTWQTAGDERVRDTHRDNDGKDFRFDTGAPIDDGEMGNPGDDINCRCVALPLVQDYEEAA